MLKKDNKFEWNAECDQAFETLRSELMKAPILAIYCPQRETELHTDASSHGFGGVIMQKQDDGKFHPVSYYSRKTSDIESKYHSFELETLAIVYSVRRFEPFLKGIEFKIVTDCSALQQTLKKKDINPRIARWALELENYTYTVIHRGGVNMGHVDALSRQVCITNETIKNKNITSEKIATITNSEIDFNLQATQARDENIKSIRDRL